MADYIITFQSHFGAVKFKKESGITGVRLMPVPRFLSSSCGTCARFSADNYIYPDDITDAEQLVELSGESCKIIKKFGE